MKNDKLDSELAEAFDNVQIEARKMRVLAWTMNCMADPSVSPPEKSMTHLDVMYLLAELVPWKSQAIDGIATEARASLHERMQASR